MTTTKEAEPAPDVHEPGGRARRRVEEMTSEEIAAAYADCVRFRAHGVRETIDQTIGYWLDEAKAELRRRRQLDLIRECLPVYYDPSRNPPVFGPGAELMQGVIERALALRGQVAAPGTSEAASR